MNLSLDERTLQRLFREIAYVALVTATLLLPAFLSLGMIAWMALGGLLAFAAIHPRSLILTVPFAIPFSFRPFDLGSLHFNILELLVVAAAVGYAPRIIWAAWKSRGSLQEIRHSTMRYLVPDRLAAGIALLLIVAGVISTLWMAEPDYLAESLRTFRWTILFPVAYFFMAAPVITHSSLNRALAAGLFLTGAVAVAMIAIVDGLLGGGIQADSVTRLSGIAPHPNALALVLARAAVAGLLIATLFRARVELTWGAPAVFVTVITVLTFSRGALLGMIAGCLLILAISRALRTTVAATALAAVGIAVVVASAPERTLSLLGGGSGSLRLELWKSAGQILRDNPITGIGLDQFLYVYLPRYVSPEAWPERFTSHPHNLLLDSWLSLGIIGLVIVGMAAVLWFRHLRVALQRQDRISLAAAGGLAAVFIHGLVDQSYFLPELAMSVWLLILLLIPETTGSNDVHSPADVLESKG